VPGQEKKEHEALNAKGFGIDCRFSKGFKLIRSGKRLLIMVCKSNERQDEGE